MAALEVSTSTILPPDLETIFATLSHDPEALFQAFMPAICNHLQADRIFLQPRNPLTLVCKVFRWRRREDVPLPNFPDIVAEKWFKEASWEIEDPLWAAALALKPSIYIEDLKAAAAEGLLNLDFENKYMKHSAFIHGHAHWPALGMEAGGRNFYGSVQPAVFDGQRIWTVEERKLMEVCLVRIAPVMKAYGEGAPEL